MNTPGLSRRSFLKSASLTSAVVAFPHVMRSQGGTSPNNRLNVACVGVGGRGAAAVAAMQEQNHVAFCDVDDARAAETPRGSGRYKLILYPKLREPHASDPKSAPWKIAVAYVAR